MADRIDITVLVDNYVDIFLSSTEHIAYPTPGSGSGLRGEQGFSLWVEVWGGEAVVRILYDFGKSEKVLLHNARLLGVDIGSADFLVLSHAHGDHYGGLRGALKQARESCRLVVHPAACGIKRFIKFGESIVGPWGIKPGLLKELRSRVLLSSGLTALGNGAYVSGGIERQTPFEKGMANAFLKKDGELVRDQIADDQALFIELSRKRLVVITGCAHAGVVNTILHAERLFPAHTIFALLGGFHLNNADEEQMGETLKSLRRVNVRHIAGVHCTGYYAQKILMDEFKDRWIPGAVGAKITFNDSNV